MRFFLFLAFLLRFFDSSLELDNGLLAISEIGDGFPSGLLLWVVNPFDSIVSDFVEPSSLEDFFDFPLLLILHSVYLFIEIFSIS